MKVFKSGWRSLYIEYFLVIVNLYLFEMFKISETAIVTILLS